MSVDGPYKSLPMPRAWKKAAERADNQAYSEEEVREAVNIALEKDFCRVHLPSLCDKLKDLLDGFQGNLFGDDQLDRLETLRGDSSGSPLASDFLDYFIQALDSQKGQEALLQAAESLIIARAVRGERQVEEHYLRKSNIDRASIVKRRLQEAREGIDIRMTAARLVGLDNAGLSAGFTKKTELDDGVQL